MRDELIRFVVRQFEHMGATPQELLQEETRLRSDSHAYETWCLRLADWCDDIPHEVFSMLPTGSSLPNRI